MNKQTQKTTTKTHLACQQRWQGHTLHYCQAQHWSPLHHRCVCSQNSWWADLLTLVDPGAVCWPRLCSSPEWSLQLDYVPWMASSSKLLSLFGGLWRKGPRNMHHSRVILTLQLFFTTKLNDARLIWKKKSDFLKRYITGNVDLTMFIGKQLVN